MRSSHVELELPAGRAQRLVDPREHPPQPARAVGGEQAKALGPLIGAERGERFLERLAGEHARLVVVDDPEPRVDAGLERVGLQQPVAEAVDRRDPGRVEVACEIGAVHLEQAPPDAAPQLTSRAFRVGDDEDRVDVDPALADGAHEALDEHGRLSGAGACGDEDEARGVDRRQLLGIRRRAHVRATRHIGASVHQLGHGGPPRGSCLTSPARMRSTKSTACSLARSVCAQNASSSR